ncbi:hypothetical protein [Sphingomonas sp.]|uniref:hypothetical protein n=1 Tax=Sphingomonas sp. TaxID=28214 RepID=UPI0025D25173|nr:hypothetical protein [Sphingomonas sp.]
MTDPTRDQPKEAPLNPALKTTTETVYDTKHPSPPPIDTASAHEGEGERWPIVWLIVTVLGVALAIFFMS